MWVRISYARTRLHEVTRAGYCRAMVEPVRCAARSPPNRRSL